MQHLYGETTKVLCLDVVWLPSPRVAFSLQGLILPVTPASLMSFIDAPVPFVLGLQYKTPEIQAR